MAKTLNFNNIKKQYMTVTLADEKNTTLMISTPTKAILDEFVNMQEYIGGDNVQSDAMEDLYEICSKIMSRNKAGIEITKEQIEEMFDFEDIMIFIKAYTDFIKEVTNRKN